MKVLATVCMKYKYCPFFCRMCIWSIVDWFSLLYGRLLIGCSCIKYLTLFVRLFWSCCIVRNPIYGTINRRYYAWLFVMWASPAFTFVLLMWLSLKLWDVVNTWMYSLIYHFVFALFLLTSVLLFFSNGRVNK